MRIRVSLRPLRAAAGPNREVECVAVRVDADGRLFAVEETGALTLLARRVWTKDDPDHWWDAGGVELKRPLIHGEPDEEVLLHFDGEEAADGKRGPWTLAGYDHVETLNLRRQRDSSSTPNFCITAFGRHEGHFQPGRRGWIRRTTELGVSFIYLAPAGFSYEGLVLAQAAKHPRERVSALAR